jgi:hypothetical protein
MGLSEMVQLKYVDVDLLPRMPKLWWYGYGQSLQRQMEGFMDLLFARSWGTKLRGALRSAGILGRGNRI